MCENELVSKQMTTFCVYVDNAIIYGLMLECNANA